MYQTLILCCHKLQYSIIISLFGKLLLEDNHINFYFKEINFKFDKFWNNVTNLWYHTKIHKIIFKYFSSSKVFSKYIFQVYFYTSWMKEGEVKFKVWHQSVLKTIIKIKRFSKTHKR